MTPLETVLLFGSVRTERRGIRAVRFVERRFQSRGHAVTVVDPLDVQLPLLDRMFKEYPPGEAPETLERLAALYRRADAFVIITGEYNHSIPPALTNLLDHFLEEYFFRPSGIVCYSAGSFGGVRAAVQLRAMLCELGMPSTPSLFPIPRIGTALADDGTPADPAVEKRFDKFASELEWYADALRQKRNAGVPY
jgi:NAD(P)H-dependent FMN reductase